jgi:hypothetical protein
MPKAANKTEKQKTVQSTKETKENVTPKDFVIEQKEGTCLFCIRFKQGGEVPVVLKGLYTNENAAEAAITSYQESR